MIDLKLFQVTTIVHEFSSRKDVRFAWFHGERYRGPRRPHAELIEGFDPTAPAEYRYMAEQHVDGLFTEDKAKQLKAYLDANYGDDGTTTIREAKLPVETNVMPLSQIPVGGLQDYWVGLTHGQLPFKPWAYFDKRGCEMIDTDSGTSGR